MIEEHFESLLQREWGNKEKEMIQRIQDGILYYKKLLPKTLKADVIAALQLCNNLKCELELLQKRLLDVDVDENVPTDVQHPQE